MGICFLGAKVNLFRLITKEKAGKYHPLGVDSRPAQIIPMEGRMPVHKKPRKVSLTLRGFYVRGMPEWLNLRRG